MLKKILISLLFLFSFIPLSYVSANGDISSTDFEINVKEITPGGADLISTNADITIENVLKRTIERFIIAIGTIALFVMTIGAGMMILYAWDDERLTRWKTIFTWWIIAVTIALLSGVIVQLVAYLLYI